MKNKALRITKDYYGFIKNMTDKQAGEFVRAVCERVYEGKPFITKDNYLKGVFAFVEKDLQVSAQNSINGKKGAEIIAKRKLNSVTANVDIVVFAESKGADKVG